MNRKEKSEVNQRLYDICCGEIFNAAFAEDDAGYRVEYDFSCPQFAVLKERYNIEEKIIKTRDYMLGSTNLWNSPE